MKIAIAFIVFAALSMFVIMKGGDTLAMGGEKHGGDHGPAPAAAAPASAAGVERVFSAAGKMHGDLQKSAKDSTLEQSLFAAYNTD